MTRTRIIACILVCTATTAGALLAWFTTALAASRVPSEQGTVLGAQTETELTALALRPYPQVRPNAQPAFANSRRFALLHAESDTLVAGSYANESVAVASTTKLMTARVVLAHANLSDSVTIESDMLSTGSTMALRVKETITVESLLYGLMLVSGNDAAKALAAHVGRILLNNPEAPFAEANTRFVQAMNEEARRLGLLETTFQDAAGLDDSGRSSARDLAKLMAVNLEDTTFTTIAATSEIIVADSSGRITHQLRHSNRLLNDFGYVGAGASKTGFTFEAGHCLVATAKRGDTTLIAVILSTYVESKEASAVEARRLLEWGFANLTVTPLSSTP